MSIGQQQPSRQTVVRQLAPIRFAFVGAVVMLTGIGVGFLFTGPGETWGAIASGVVALTVIALAITVPTRMIRPLEPATPDPAGTAQARIRAAAFVSLAFAEFPVMLGLAMSIVSTGWLPVAVGGSCALVALLTVGPSESRVNAWIERLESAGEPTRL